MMKRIVKIAIVVTLIITVFASCASGTYHHACPAYSNSATDYERFPY